MAEMGKKKKKITQTNLSDCKCENDTEPHVQLAVLASRDGINL